VTRIAGSELESVLDAALLRLKPGIVMTQLMWSERVLVLCRRRGVPTVYFARSTGGNLDVSHGGEYEATFIVANSEVTQREIQRRWNRGSIVVYPLIDPEQYHIQTHSPRYITMVNPVIAKGGAIFREIALALPDRQFMAVRAWDHLRDAAQRDWDRVKMQEMAAAFRDTPHIPQEAHLDDVPNVHLRGPFRDMRNVYEETRLLLVPSVWEEAFGRVAVEAMLNSIPVAASDRGNLAHTVGAGGILVKDPQDIEAWVRAIESLDEELAYRTFQTQAKASAARFDMIAEAEKVRRMLLALE
jgi:glycosyltransferase involved in cell wall biosynthesis